jgi:lysophospholipase L1-like esterase
MSNQLYSGQGRDINVFAGQSLAVSSITGAYTATIIAGAGIGTALATDSTGGATYGPYSGGVTVRLKAGEGALLDYEAAVGPMLNYAGPLNAGYNQSGDVASAVDGDGKRIGVTSEGYRAVLFGDSMVDTYETVVSGVTCAYDSLTGVLTVTSAGHQQAVGWYVTIWNRNFSASNKLFRRPVLTVADANTFTVNIGAGLAVTASDANWRYRPESWRSAQNFVQWMQGACGHRFNIVYNGGASGDRADEALVRVDVDCLDYNPDVVICQMPGINDLGAANTTRDVESIFADQKAIIDRITATPALLLLLTTTPVATGEGRATLNNMSKVRDMNRRLTEYCKSKPRVVVFDAWRRVVNPTDATGLAASGFLRTTDNIHYSLRGGRAIGEALWAQVSSLFPSDNGTLPASVTDSFTASALTLSSISITAGVCTATASAVGLRVGDRRKVTWATAAFSEYVTILTVVGSVITFATTNGGSTAGTVRIGATNNMIDTPLWTTATGGTLAGGPTGVAASGIKVSTLAGSPTVVASVPSRGDGLGNDQQVVITAAAASNQVSIEADFNWASNGGSVNWPGQVKAGRRYSFEGEISLSGVSGSNLSELRPTIAAVIDGTTYLVYALNGYAEGPVLNTDLTAFHFKTAPMVLPAGTTVTNFKWQITALFSAAGTALTLKVGRCRLAEEES